MSSRLHALLLALTCLPVVGCGDDAASAGSQSGDDGSTAGDSGVATTTGVLTTTGVTAGSTGSAEGGSSTSTGEGGSSSDDTGRTTSTTSTESTGSSTGDETTGSSSSSTGSESSTSGDTTGVGTTDNAGFVGLSNEDVFAVFDSVTQVAVGVPVSILPEADYPYDATITPDGTEVWFVGAAGDGVVAVDTATSEIVASVPLSTDNPYPVDVVFTADGTTAFVASRDGESITLFDVAGHTETSSFPTPGGADAGKMALNPCTGQIYVVEWFGGALMTYDPAADAWSSVEVGGSLWDVVVAPDGSTVYVIDRSADAVHVFDVSMTDGVPMSVPEVSVAVGDDPWGIDITADGGTLVVVSEDSGQVHFIDTTTLVASALALPIGASSRDVDINTADTLAFVPSGIIDGDDGVFVLDIAAQEVSNTITITGASNPNVIAVAPQMAACAD